MKLNSGNELTTAEGDLRTLVASLAQHLQSANVKNADDVTSEVMPPRWRTRTRN